jgi:hypothetical protein
MSDVASCRLPSSWSLKPAAARLLHGSRHRALPYDVDAFPFARLVRRAILGPNSTSLESLRVEGANHPVETEHARLFYAAASREGGELRRAYRRFIRHLHAALFPDEEVLVFQTLPSIRIQYPNHTLVWLHRDADAEGAHPVGEVNFLLPLTPMFGSASVRLESHESQPGARDFVPVSLCPGELMVFDGNACSHGSDVPNSEGFARVSLDFRIVPGRVG